MYKWKIRYLLKNIKEFIVSFTAIILGSGRDGTNACTLANGQPLQRAVRQEYRMFSDAERNRYHATVNTLKRSGVYDEIATLHANAAVAGSAHGAPSFFPWHREFIKRSNKFLAFLFLAFILNVLNFKSIYFFLSVL